MIGAVVAVVVACLLVVVRFGVSGPVWTDGVAAWAVQRSLPPAWLVVVTCILSIVNVVYLIVWPKRYRAMARILAGVMVTVMAATGAYAIWVERVFCR